MLNANTLFNRTSVLTGVTMMALLASFSGNAQDHHEPQIERLETKAGRSSQLYVEPDFEFATHKQLTLDIAAASAAGEPHSNAMIFVYSIAPEVVALDDERVSQRSLLTILKTDDTGKVYRTFEVAQQVTNLLVEIRVVGISNQALANFAHTDTVELFFGEE